jgi:hypothetical protein
MAETRGKKADATEIRRLLDACSLLFGGTIMCSPAFLRSLRPEGLRDAYRRRLLESHPDRAEIIGASPEELHARTIAINEAYCLLQDGLDANWSSLGSAPSPQPAGPASSAVDAIRYEGPLPQRALRFGEYLYYRGIISWQELIEALCDQRHHRPLIGELAVRLRYLVQEDIASVRASQRSRERFGETAVRLGLLTRGEVAVLLGRQIGLGHPLGHFLVEKGLLTAARLTRLVEEHRQHVRRHGTH